MAPDREVVQAPDAPEAVGAYSHAVRVEGLLFCSGQIPLEPSGAGLVGGNSAAEQCRQCLRNLDAVCRAAETGLGDAARVTIYTTQLDQAAEIDRAYAEFFQGDLPARLMIGVAALPKGALVEVEAVVATGP